MSDYWEGPLLARRFIAEHPRSIAVPVLRMLLANFEAQEQAHAAYVRSIEYQAANRRMEARKASDQAIVIRDQQTYIKSLEEQLLPHLTAPQPEQQVIA